MNVRRLQLQWKRCSLSIDQLRTGALIQITNNFMRIMDDIATPLEAMLFWRATSDGLDFFASPQAARHLCDPALVHYGWTDCARPDPTDLIVLAGQCDPQRLFVPSRLTLVSSSPHCVGA